MFSHSIATLSLVLVATFALATPASAQTIATSGGMSSSYLMMGAGASYHSLPSDSTTIPTLTGGLLQIDGAFVYGGGGTVGVLRQSSFLTGAWGLIGGGSKSLHAGLRIRPEWIRGFDSKKAEVDVLGLGLHVLIEGGGKKIRAWVAFGSTPLLAGTSSFTKDNAYTSTDVEFGLEIPY